MHRRCRPVRVWDPVRPPGVYPFASQLPILAAGHGKLKFLYLDFAAFLRTTPTGYALLGTLKLATRQLAKG
jgi:hypothetical protein